MKNQKGFSILAVVLILVLAVILVVAGYFAYKYFNTQKEQAQIPEQNISNQTANWKTYTNTDYGFEFQYPAEARFMVDSGGVKNDHPIIHLMKDLPNANVYTIAVLLSTNDVYPLPKMPWVLKTEEVYVNGIKMTKTLYGPPEGSNEKGLVYLDYDFVVNGQLYEFIADSTKPNVMDTDVANLLIQIVNSFKSTNSTSISKQDAVNLVRDLPEVQAWLRNYKVTNAPVKPVIEVDHETEILYVVHVYEINGDHTATHNWYDVNKKTGEINPEF